MTRLAINGFGRIGRAAFKIALESEDVEVVAINDLVEIDNLAYLLRYDSVYGRYGRSVEVKGDKLIIDNQEIRVHNQSDPENLPWQDLAIDVVIESTGVFTNAADAQKHLNAGAKNVIISAPVKSDETATVVLGVNNETAKGKNIISTASCTTNCAAPVMAVMDNSFGVEKGIFTTIHAYTASQGLVDSPAKKDPRRGRAGALNMVPTSTGAADAVVKSYKALAGKLDGIAIRVPVPVVSIGDFTFITKENVTVDEVNQAFKAAEENPIYHGVLAVTEEPMVSTDFIGDPHSAIIDAPMTRVVGGNLVKVIAWYDNEWGYSNRLIEQVVEIGKQ